MHSGPCENTKVGSNISTIQTNATHVQISKFVEIKFFSCVHEKGKACLVCGEREREKER